MIVRSKMVIADDEEVLPRVSASLVAPPIVPPAIAPLRILQLEAHANTRLPFLMDPAGLAVEQFKLLRGRLNARAPGGGILVVTSPARLILFVWLMAYPLDPDLNINASR